MTFEEAKDMERLHSIDPSLVCSCDDNHECQNCVEAFKSYQKERIQLLEAKMASLNHKS